ncbi:MAG: MOSC domain-containing protein [Ruminococcaceae bacterium]|nr:MOSC domain-containing protein [Oscillospiraceae bacterium]
MAKVLSINISEKKGTPKTEINPGVLIEEFGFEGDAHAGKWHRQVSLLAKESIEKSKGLPTDGLCHGVFAENITTEGIILHTLPVGTRLKINECILEITQIGKECHDGCAIRQLVGQCIMPREGIFCRVIKGGKIYKNDEIEIVE